jgi:putative transposase
LVSAPPSVASGRSVKTTAIAGERGCDAAKKVTGRKRHILVDVFGLLLEVVVTKANVLQREGAKMLLKRALGHHFERQVLIWADGGYQGQAFCDWVMEHCGWLVEIVKRSDDAKALSSCLDVGSWNATSAGCTGFGG